MKILKNKFVSSTFILILSGMSTKLLGLLIKIIFTRITGPKTIALYTIVMPTYSLLLTISSFSMPSTISKIIAQNDDIKVLNTASIIILMLNILIILIMLIISPYIATNLLHEPKTYYLLIAMTATLPFASLACILKGYYYGKQKMVPHVTSNTIEQIIRLILILTIIPLLIKKSYVLAAVGLILTNLITELASIITFLCFMKKNEIIKLKEIKFNKVIKKEIFELSIPSVSGRIIGNISFFFEPIILTTFLLKNGYSSNYILMQYGAYNAYAISTLTIPSFFINAIALALIPEISKYNSVNNYQMVKKRLLESCIFTLILGSFFSLTIFIFRDKLLLLLYNTTNGTNYIKYLAFFFILFYFENIFTSFFEAIGNTKIILKITIISAIIKNTFLIILSNLRIGLYSLLIAEIISIIIIIILDLLNIKKTLKKLRFSSY